MPRCLFEPLLFISVDVRPLAFRETVNENRALTVLEKNNRTVFARLTLPRPRDPLLNNLAAKVGVYLSFFRASYCL